MLTKPLALGGKFAVGGVALSALVALIGPERTKAYWTYLRGKARDATPVEVKVEEISERLDQKDRETTDLRTSVARIDETCLVLGREADELRERIRARTQRIAAGEEVQRRAGQVRGEAFDGAQVERALAAEREELLADRGQLEQRELRGRVLAERGALYRRKLGEFAGHIGALRQRLDGLRSMQASNRTLEEMVAVQAEIEKQFALPGASTPDFGDELAELEVELKARQATLTDQLAGGLTDPADVLGRAVEAVKDSPAQAAQ